MDPDKRREQRRQSMLLDRLDARFAPMFAKEIRRAMTELVDVYEATGEVMDARDHYASMEAIFTRMAQSAVLTFGGRMLQQGKDAGLILERKEDFAQTLLRMALQYVAGEYIRRKITSITNTTREQIVNQVQRGYQEGLGVSSIARMIRDAIPAISMRRGALIARTETHGAANFGANAAAEETGLNIRKEWVAADDERTRLDHAQAGNRYSVGGEIGPIGMKDAFDVGGSLLMYPGDPSGPADQVINCRCAIAHIVVDE